MCLQVPEEVREALFNVDKSVLNDGVLKPWRQLVVERLRHKGFKARLALLKLNDIHEIVPRVRIEPLAALFWLELVQLAPCIVNILQRAINIVDKYFGLLRLLGDNVIDLNVKFERKQPVFYQSKGEDGHELDASDQDHVPNWLVADVVRLGRFKVTVAHGGHRSGHEVQLVNINLKSSLLRWSTLLVQRNPAVFRRAVDYVDAGCQVKREVQEDGEGDHLLHVPDDLPLERKDLDERKGVCSGGAENLGNLRDPEQTQVAKDSHVAELHDFLVILPGVR